ncbi:MAG: P-type DNA transfer ATPase VirB11 [Tatlockia sp.]|nr:P-type DNA transfer ATPase VirB11 [Tatlockia sp.]
MSLALQTYLKPLDSFLARKEVSEICINKPGELWLEEKGQFTRHEVVELTEKRLRFLAHLIAEYNHKNLSELKPLLSATLPNGERCQLVLPPACERGQFICAIRKPTVADLSLMDWETRGAFQQVNEQNARRLNPIKKTLEQHFQNGQWQALLSFAIRSKLNILFCGGTSTAKTTLLNSCLKEIPTSERLITIEGVREVVTTLPNSVHLLANEEADNQSTVSILDLLKVCFRLRPDRIFLSELRAKEAYPFLRACISGHPGSLTTLHADSVASAKEQLCFMLSEAPELQAASEERLQRLIRTSVHLIVQMARADDGRRFIEAIDIEGVLNDLV